MVWYSHLFTNFPQCVVTYTVKGFGIVKKPEVKNKAVATGLEKVIHSNPKQKQCQ